MEELVEVPLGREWNHHHDDIVLVVGLLGLVVGFCGGVVVSGSW